MVVLGDMLAHYYVNIMQVFKLIRQREHTITERLTLLSEYRQNVLNKIALMQKKLTGIDVKIAHYANQEMTI